MSGGVFLVLFFVLGWAYYMASRILMSGSIFVGLRAFIGRKADEGSRVALFFREMLGCMMCTATELALWTLGASVFGLALAYDTPARLVEAVFAGHPVALALPVTILSALGLAVAASFAVAGEAWGIKCIVEHREEKFLALREEFRTREEENLARIVELSQHAPSTAATPALTFNNVMVGGRRFSKEFEKLTENRRCKEMWCRYSRTTCYVRVLLASLQEWWFEKHENIDGFEVYQQVLGNAIRTENKLYWAFWADSMQSSNAVYQELKQHVERALNGEPLDNRQVYGPEEAWPSYASRDREYA